MGKDISCLIAALREVDRQLSRIISTTPHPDQLIEDLDYWYILDRDTRFMFVSDSGAAIFGVTPHEMIGLVPADLNITEQVKEKLINSLETVVVTGNPLKGETNLPLISSNTHLYGYRMFPIKDKNGEVEAILCVGRNITDYKNSEKRLLGERKRIQRILELSPLPVLVIDKEYKIIALNQKYVDFHPSIAGKIPLEFIGISYRTLTNVCDLQYEDTVIIQALKGKEIRQKFSHAYARDWLASAGPFLGENNESLGAIAFFQDITDFKTLQQELVKLDRLNLIGQMAAGIAHEIRNPLTVVKGYLQMMRNRARAEDLDRFALVLDEIGRVEVLINDFLSMARNKNTATEPQCLNKLINEAITLMTPEANKVGVEVKTVLCDQLPQLSLNEKEIKQLLLNLVRNSLDATESPGVIIVETSIEHAYAVLRIIDTGLGIAPEIQSKVFDPFYTSKDSGTGLGLSVCGGIVHRHGGTIKIESELGKGTKVTVCFPL